MAGSDGTPFRRSADGVTVVVKATPKASRTRVTGLAQDADGSCRLAVAVAAAPEGGKANAALIRLLAKEWRIAKSAITLASGAGARRKSLHVAGDPDRLLLDLTAWLTDMR